MIFALGNLIHPLEHSQDAYLVSTWVEAHVLIIIGSFMLALGLPALYLRQGEKRGVLGFIGLILTLIGLAGAGIVYAFLPKSVEVDLAAATRGPMLVTVDEDGQTRIKEKYIVSSPVGGQLVRIDLKAGDPITAERTVLATIRPSDPTILDARQVAEAEARVAAARVAIERAGAGQAQAEAAQELADSEFARAKQLFESNSLSQSEFDAALAVARQRAEELRAATFDRAELDALLALADGGIDRLLEAQRQAVGEPLGRVLR